MKRVRVIDSHTAGEPTRVVVAGGPDLGGGSTARQRDVFRDRFDRYRRAIVTEPRGSDVLVGALLCEPEDASCVTGVIFFDNVQCIGMCGHGTIGVVATLAHLGRIRPGAHRIETPVGVVTATLHADGAVSVRNVPSHRRAKGVRVTLEGGGEAVGDVAYGGNWFYVVDRHGHDLELANAEALTGFTRRIRRAINEQGHPDVDHILLLGPARRPDADARNFVLCPGGVYDRSPCGTGTSAVMACRAADGALTPGRTWLQEGIIGTTFAGSYAWAQDGTQAIIPTVQGAAFMTAEADLVLDERDPLCYGFDA